MSPPFMKEIFCHKENAKCTRSGDIFVRPHVESVKKGDRSLRSFGPIIWNTMLPEKLKESASLDIFKESIKSWIPDNCPCELCKTYVPGLGYVSVFEWEDEPDKHDLNGILNVQNCIHQPSSLGLLDMPSSVCLNYCFWWSFVDIVLLLVSF